MKNEVHYSFYFYQERLVENARLILRYGYIISCCGFFFFIIIIPILGVVKHDSFVTHVHTMMYFNVCRAYCGLLQVCLNILLAM